MALKSEIVKNHFRVSIYGSARIKKNDPIYKKIYTLAKMIGKEKMDVVTGGGPGLMQAASDGHEAGDPKNHTHTIGLLIKLPHEQKANFHLDLKEEFDRFSKRLDNFISLSNVVVVAPGGVGTMLEFFYSWQLMQVDQSCDIPIILFGPMWDGLVEWIKKQPLKRGYLTKKDMNSIFVVNSASEAMHIIREAKNHFDKGTKNVCINLQKYKLI